MDQDIPPVNFIIEKPTVKDQIIGALIGLGATLVLFFGLTAGSWLFDKVALAKKKRHDRKIARAQALLDQEQQD